MPVWNDTMAAHQAASGHVSVNSAFTWSLPLCNAHQFCSSNVWVLQHYSVHDFDMSTIIVFVYFGLQFKWNPFSTNNSRHTSCIHKGLHAGTWPAGLQIRCSQYTGIALGRLHWNHTGWCYHPVLFQWQSGGNMHNWNTMEDQWSHKYTGMPLEPHWLMLVPSGVLVTTQW